MTRKECICMVNTAGIIKDAKVLDARGSTANRLLERYGLSKDIEDSLMMEIRDDAQYLRTGINSFERTCDVSKLGDRFDQYQSGKDKLEQFKQESKNLKLAIDAGTQIYGAVISKIEKGLIVDCK